MRNWITSKNGLHTTIKFSSFSELTLFLAKIGPIADEMNHHPDCTISKAVVLDIQLITHELNSITEKDWELARQIDACLGQKK